MLIALTFDTERLSIVANPASRRAWLMLRRVQVGLDVINIGVVTNDFIQQYRAIQDSKMSPEEKRKALTQLAAFSVLSGAMMIVPLRSASSVAALVATWVRIDSMASLSW